MSGIRATVAEQDRRYWFWVEGFCFKDGLIPRSDQSAAVVSVNRRDPGLNFSEQDGVR